MTDSIPADIVINPLWVTLALPALRWLVTVAGASSATVDTNTTTAVLKGAVSVAMLAWSTYSWWRAHQKAKALNAAPIGAAVVK